LPPGNLEEQRTHLLTELRSITDAGKSAGLADLAPDAAARFREVERQVSTINRELEDEHEAELQEIRSANGAGNGSGGFFIEQKTMSRIHAREPLYEAFRRAGFARGKP